MESSGLVRQGDVGHSNYPSQDRRRTSFHQGTMLMLVIFSIQFHSTVSVRNESLMAFDTPRPWNQAYYKAERGCHDFHDQPNVSSYFFYWPEDDPHFQFCCVWRQEENSTLYLENFTYGIHGPMVGSAIYYDLGLIDQCLPYWKCRGIYRNLYKILTYHLNCERTDLEGLYNRRFWNAVVLKHGVLQSAIPFILSLEVLVVLFALCWSWQCDIAGSRCAFMKEATTAWFGATRKTILSVWLHLLLIAVIGNGLIEAMGRQNPYLSQSKSFYNYARLYVGLSVLVWLSSLFQQLSYWVAVIEDKIAKIEGCDVLSLPVLKTAQPDSQSASNGLPQSQSVCPHESVLEQLVKKVGLETDWKWQPIAAQLAILFCLWGFLTYVNDDNSMAAGVFGIVVQAAAPWSGLYSMKILLTTSPFIARRVFYHVKAGSCSPAMCLPRWRGRRGRHHADPEDPDVPLSGLRLQRSDTP